MGRDVKCHEFWVLSNLGFKFRQLNIQPSIINILLLMGRLNSDCITCTTWFPEYFWVVDKNMQIEFLYRISMYNDGSFELFDYAPKTISIFTILKILLAGPFYMILLQTFYFFHDFLSLSFPRLFPWWMNVENLG